MATPDQSDQPTTISDRFMTVLKSRRPTKAAKERRVIEDPEYIQALWRWVRALELRTIERPENLAQVLALSQRMDEIVNVAIAANAEIFEIDPRRAMSMAECARILGISKQAASQRRARGKAIMLGRVAAAGVFKFSEAKREKEAIESARVHAVTQLDEYRAKHKRAS